MFASLLDIIFPKRCMFCMEFTGNADICITCWMKIKWISQSSACCICGAPMRYKIYEKCTPCIENTPIYDKAVSVFEYDEFSKRAIINLKHNDSTYLAKTFAGLMYRDFVQARLTCDVITIVPMYRNKLLKRMYNQSALLARYISKMSNIHLDPHMIEKIKNTLPQEGLSSELRMKNLHGAFIVREKKKPLIQNKSILLIDDVITTGSTANECAKVLKHAGAKQVSVLTIAKTIKQSQR